MNINVLISRLKEEKSKDNPVLINTACTGRQESYFIYLDYIGPHWAKGHRYIYNEGNKVQIPETINYGDLIADSSSHRKYNTEIKFMGDNPFV